MRHPPMLLPSRIPHTLTMLLALTMLAASPLQAGRSSLSISTEGDSPITSCDQIDIRFGDEVGDLETARAEQHLAAPKADVSALRISLPRSAGVTVRGWDSELYDVTLCKAVGARDRRDAQALLDGISASLDDGRVSMSGPPGDRWVVYLIVRAPKDAVLDLEAENGSIALREITGRITARNRNGSISLKKCSGQIEVSCANGSIDLEAGAGRNRLTSGNGPVSVKLTSRTWQGEGLDAVTANGPLSLTLPGDYRSGVRVRMSGHGPVSCRAEACTQARRNRQDDSRTIEMGDGDPVVRLETGNGPVSIDSEEETAVE